MAEEELPEVEERPQEPQGDGGDAGGAEEARITELELALEEMGRDLAAYRSELAIRGEEVASLKGELALAVVGYRRLLLAGAPEVPEELVTGETVAGVEASLEAARHMVERVRRQIEARANAQRVPVGAPPRRAPDLAGLSPQEKIAYALGRRP